MKNTQAVFLAGRLNEAADDFLLAELRREGAEGLVPSHGDILSALLRQDGLPMSAIATKTHRTKSTVSALADRLEKYGYLERRRSSEDARVVGLYLTEKGRALKPAFSRISDRLSERVCAGFTSEEVRLLEKLLERALHNF